MDKAVGIWLALLCSRLSFSSSIVIPDPDQDHQPVEIHGPHEVNPEPLCWQMRHAAHAGSVVEPFAQGPLGSINAASCEHWSETTHALYYRCTAPPRRRHARAARCARRGWQQATHRYPAPSAPSQNRTQQWVKMHTYGCARAITRAETFSASTPLFSISATPPCG